MGSGMDEGTSTTRIPRAVLLLLVAYGYWTLYSLIYPVVGRWSVDYTRLLLRLPGTSHDFVLGLLMWTKGHPALYLLMDTLYKLGFTWVMVGTVFYLLHVSPAEAERTAKSYLVSFLVLSAIFLVAHVFPPHLVYPDLPRRYSPPGWSARPQFVLPSPHCTVDTVSLLALVRRKEVPARILAFLVALIPVSTVLLAEHWVWDALSGVLLGWLVDRYSGRFLTPANNLQR